MDDERAQFQQENQIEDDPVDEEEIRKQALKRLWIEQGLIELEE